MGQAEPTVSTLSPPESGPPAPSLCRGGGRAGARLPGAADAFWNAQLAINGVAFPAGLALFVLLSRPVTRGLRGRPGDVDGRARRRCLQLGHCAAGISLAGWLLAGTAYPVGLSLTVGPLGLLPVLHFMASLALCGLVAVSYPFFAVAFLSVRALYPALLRSGSLTAADGADLIRLGRHTGPYLLVAASVPLLAVMLLVLIRSESRFALGVLSTAGLAGLGVAVWLARTLQADLAALARTVDFGAGASGRARLLE